MNEQLDNLKLEEQLCFALYNATNSITRLYRKLLDEYQLTYPQYLVLIVLWQQDRITISELRHKLNLDSGTISPLIQRMAKAGLLYKETNRQDHRSIDICLTEKAQQLKPLISQVQNKVACSTNLSSETFHNLIDTLNRLSKDLEQS